MQANPALDTNLISWMITELVEHISSDSTTHREVTHLRILFPEPATNPGVISNNQESDGEEICTFSMNP